MIEIYQKPVGGNPNYYKSWVLCPKEDKETSVCVCWDCPYQEALNRNTVRCSYRQLNNQEDSAQV